MPLLWNISWEEPYWLLFSISTHSHYTLHFYFLFYLIGVCNLPCTSDITCCRGSHHNLCWSSWTRCVERILPVLQGKQICKLMLSMSRSWHDYSLYPQLLYTTRLFYFNLQLQLHFKIKNRAIYTTNLQLKAQTAYFYTSSL